MRTLVSIVAIILLALGTAGLVVYLTVTEKADALSAAESTVVISEAMSGNKGVCLDDKGKSSDWVELYNPGDEAVSLKYFALSDDEEDLEAWTFPDVSLESHGYMVVYLSGSSQKRGALHASFKLKAQGEQLVLSVAGIVMDSVNLPEMPDNVSYSRTEQGWMITEDPTPGAPNNNE
jgi:hypothetical protein